MFGGKKLILTATTCRLIEGVRLALEILFGETIRFKYLELEKSDETFNSGNGILFRGKNEIPILFSGNSEREGVETYLDIRVGEKWHVARFDSPRKVRIIEKNGGMWFVGTSAADRHLEQLHILAPYDPEV